MIDARSRKEDAWLGENLAAQGTVTISQLMAAQKEAKEHSLPLREVLIHRKMIRESKLLAVYATEFGMEILNIAERDYQMVDTSLSRLLPLKFCLKYKVLPIFRIIDEDLRELTLAVTTPFAADVIAEVARLTGCRVTPVLTTVPTVEGGIAKLY